MIKGKIINPQTLEAEEFMIPTSWKEFTLRQLCEYYTLSEQGKMNSKEWLALMTGIPLSTWDNVEAKQAIKIANSVNVILQEEQPNWEDFPRKEKIKITGIGEFKPQSNVGLLKYAAYLTAESLVNNYIPKKELNFIPQLLAHLFYDKATGKEYDSDKAEELIPFIEASPANVTYPWAVFFCLEFGIIIKNGQVGLVNQLIHQNKKRLVLNPFRLMARRI